MMAFRPACFLTFHTVAIYSAKERYDTWLKSQEEFNDSFMVQVLHGLNIDRFTCLHTHSSQFPEIHIWNTHIYTHIYYIYFHVFVRIVICVQKKQTNKKNNPGPGLNIKDHGRVCWYCYGNLPCIFKHKKNILCEWPLTLLGQCCVVLSCHHLVILQKECAKLHYQNWLIGGLPE